MSPEACSTSTWTVVGHRRREESKRLSRHRERPPGHLGAGMYNWCRTGPSELCTWRKARFSFCAATTSPHRRVWGHGLSSPSELSSVVHGIYLYTSKYTLYEVHTRYCMHDSYLARIISYNFPAHNLRRSIVTGFCRRALEVYHDLELPPPSGCANIDGAHIIPPTGSAQGCSPQGLP